MVLLHAAKMDEVGIVLGADGGKYIAPKEADDLLELALFLRHELSFIDKETKRMASLKHRA